MHLSKEELIEAAYDMTGGNIADLSKDQVLKLMTVTQFVTDICLNEIERRGELITHGGYPVVPYHSDHWAQTILTRGNNEPS